MKILKNKNKNKNSYVFPDIIHFILQELWLLSHFTDMKTVG